VIGLKITASGWLQEVDLPGDAIATLLNCTSLQRETLRHNVELWHDSEHTDRGSETNMAAICILLNCADHDADTVPLIGGDVVLLGTDPATGRPASLAARDQYLQLGYTLLVTLNA
jgi:hypothetical protein